MQRSTLAALLLILSAALAPNALAQDNDFEWAIIDHPGNASYQSPDPDFPSIADGRGSVSYTFRIAKMEVSTAQWMEFVNTFSTQGGGYGFTDTPPIHWGAQIDPDYHGTGWKYRLQNGDNSGLAPVGGIIWRDAARYCNWLHNGKLTTPDSLITGAYDTTTFGGDAGGISDAPVHLAGAKYWIPTYDEWLKATFFDPNRHGSGSEGWWSYANSSESPGISGPPGIGTTSCGWREANFGEWEIPLSAYPASLSPWGLLDTSGGGREWTEDLVGNERRSLGSFAGARPISARDLIGDGSSIAPFLQESGTGLRVASIPSPATPLSALTFFLVLTPLRRR